MSTLIDVVSAEIRDRVKTLEGEIFGRPPNLWKTDGQVLTYCVDVRIFTDNPATGRQWTEDEDPVITEYGGERILRNVPIALGNRELTYAEPGAAVTLARTSYGQFEIIGFSKKKPGKFHRVPVDLTTRMPGTPENVGSSVHVLTLEELGDPKYGGGFGTVPLGAYAVLRGDDVVEIKS